MRKPLKISIILTLILIFSCKENNLQDKTNEIVIIVSNPEKIKTNIGTGINIKTLDRLNYDTSKLFDTIKVNANNYLKIYLKNDNTFKYIICKNNDTVYLNIDKKDITLKIKDRAFKKYDTVSLAFLYNSLKKEKSEIKSLENKIYIKDNWTQNKKLNKTFVDSNKNVFLDYHKMLDNLAFSSNEILNKLYHQDSISLPYYNYFKSQNNYQVYANILEAFSYSDDEYLKNEILGYLNKEDVINDDFIAYGYLNGFISKILINKNGYDFEESYDALPSFMSGNALKYSQLICLKEIASNYGFSIFQTYKNKYLSSYNSEETRKIIESIIEEFNLNSNFIEEENLSEVQLQDINGKKTTLEELINFNVNKVIYIDYWASWCVPCRQVMPASEKLRAEYANKDIVFVYISIDTDLKKWSTASHTEKLHITNYSLLAANYPQASFYKKIELEYIPRYLIIKNGMLENSKAPSPDTKEIKILLDKLLNERI